MNICQTNRKIHHISQQIFNKLLIFQHKSAILSNKNNIKGVNIMSENLHAKHRKRMRKRFMETNAEGFSDHELLELLLFYCVPRKNTNDIAHRLLNRFGNFEGIFSASIV